MAERRNRKSATHTSPSIRRGTAYIALSSCLVTLSCEAVDESQRSPVSSSVQALPDLSHDERARFLAGAGEFSEVESSAEGLGPFFNGSSCGHCHVEGGLGGGGVMRVLRVMCKDAEGELTAPAAGALLHAFSTRPDVATPGVPRSCDPVFTERRTTNVRGAGLLEAIDDDAILEEEIAQKDTVGGRAAIVRDVASGRERVGRFGWKAQHATLDSFAAEAYLMELGITNELFPEEVAPNGDLRLLEAIDPTPDPEAAGGAIDSLADFMRFSAPPEPTKETDAGLETFRDIGCATCHRESYRTLPGSSAVNSREVRLFSDLLLHDVGTGDGVPQGPAFAWEVRTPPLWGLGESTLFLHDGSAASIDAAIRAHGAQAEPARVAFESLGAPERRELLSFLLTL